MASKAVLLVLASFLLINTKVSSEWGEETLTQGSKLAPTGVPNYKSSPPPPPPPTPKAAPPPSPSPPPAKSPYPPPVTKATPPPPPPPVKAPPPPPCPPPPVQPPRNREECKAPCGVRCSKHSRQNICIRACLACCERCKCVPPGQYGNYEKCGKCYSTMTTHGGKLKCP